MTTDTDKDLQALLRGDALDGSSTLHIDLPKNGKFVPVTKESVCYIVAAVIINDHQEVLMMQEAKESCRGKWYLPAGRMELNETLEEGVKREVLEETGIEFEPTSLCAVEIQSGVWYRFTFTGSVTGGSLKTLTEQDAESLQARWCATDSITNHNSQLPLRSSDVVRLVHTVLAYHRTEAVDRHPTLRPQLMPHTKLLLRVVLVQSQRGDWNVLIGKKGAEHFPTGEMSQNTSLQTALKQLLQQALGNHHITPTWHGVLSLEHAGKPARVNDGVCVTLLASLQRNEAGTDAPPSLNKAFEWHLLKTQSICENLTSRLRQGMTVPLKIY
ncbi:8-oxo-dGDP phosphatase NUDT18 [Lamellibrachia satsuma]|nr:8-oxo-dGDP phosphatase NUDT18 [Lamellibrachia satsuma]